MVENKTVGADSISARGVPGAIHLAGAYRMRPYGYFFERCAAPRSTAFIIYYFLFIICITASFTAHRTSYLPNTSAFSAFVG